MKISSFAATRNYSANCKLNYAIYLLRQTMNKITTAIFTIKILWKVKYWKLRNSSAHIYFDTVIFEQLSSEKPNLEKPVQQMRVLLLIFNSNSEYNNLDAQQAI